MNPWVNLFYGGRSVRGSVPVGESHIRDYRANWRSVNSSTVRFEILKWESWVGWLSPPHRGLPYDVTNFSRLTIYRMSNPMSEQTPGKLYDAAMKLKADGNLEGCVDALKNILTIDPNHVQTHMALGVHQQKLGRFEEAIFHARKVAELEPSDAFSFTQLSVIYQRCGKIFEAEEAMARAREIQGTPKRH